MDYHKRLQRSPGFTIVELLIVIVVIAVLASITIVSYNGVINRARASTIQNNLADNFKVLAISNSDNGIYPSVATAGLKSDNGITLTYIPNATSTAYCLQASGYSNDFYITDANSAPQSGTCTPAPPSLPTPIASYNFNAGSGGSVIDNSGNGRTLTITSGSWSAGGRTGGGFTGASGGGGARLATFTNPSPAITTMGWVRPTSAGTGAWRSLFGFFDTSGSTNSYFVVYQNRNDWGTDGKVQVNTRIGGSLYGLEYTALPVGTWAHVAASFDGSVVRLYINGVEVATRAQSGTLSTNTLFSVGDGANAVIDDVRVFNSVLTSSEITSLMNTPV